MMIDHTQKPKIMKEVNLMNVKAKIKHLAELGGKAYV